MTADQWPALALDEWLPTYATLHRWMQIVGKTRLALSPFENHWWHCALYVTARGVSTSAIPCGNGDFEVEFDFLKDSLFVRTSDDENATIRLENKSVAGFYHEYRSALAGLGIRASFHAAPTEIADATPFADDRSHATYDADAARRWWRALIHADQTLKEFRGRFAGKCSPSHLWWGGLDLACTRFSGRRAPPHPDVPYCPSYVTAEAYSHECISAGWWPGTPGSPVAEPAFYAYAYPEPDGCNVSPISPRAARYDPDLREWILPYAAVRASMNPEETVAEFFESTYEAAATLGGWDIAALRSSRALTLSHAEHHSA
jgi:uncharacterized protein DUF5996